MICGKNLLIKGIFKMKMKYKLGLRIGGLMEMPEWTIQNIREVWAEDLKQAKYEWAKVTGEDQKDTWNPKTQTVWGW
jgi:hypothetical protein